jgi:hypothetical protein
MLNEIISYIGKNFLDLEDCKNARLISKQFSTEIFKEFNTHHIKLSTAMYSNIQDDCELFCKKLLKYKPGLKYLYIDLLAWSIYEDNNLDSFLNIIRFFHTKNIIISLNIQHIQNAHMTYIINELLDLDLEAMKYSINIYWTVNINMIPYEEFDELTELDDLMCSACDYGIITMQNIQIDTICYEDICKLNIMNKAESIELKTLLFSLFVDEDIITINEFENCKKISLLLSDSDIEISNPEKIDQITNVSWCPNAFEHFMNKSRPSQFKKLVSVRFSKFISSNLPDLLVGFPVLAEIVFDLNTNSQHVLVFNTMVSIYEKTKIKKFILYALDKISYYVSRLILEIIKKLKLSGLKITLEFENVPVSATKKTFKEICASITKHDTHYTQWASYIKLLQLN